MSQSPDAGLPPVMIVGAGPGAPDLMTLRAARAVESAEVLVWTDSLVSPAIAALAPEGCERIRTSTLTLEEVLEVVVERARAGRRVVRLHDGDPCLYGALQEQICRLADAGLAVEVVPGISAYQATAAALGSAEAPDLIASGAVVGGVSLLIAFWAVSTLPETHVKDLDYVEVS